MSFVMEMEPNRIIQEKHNGSPGPGRTDREINLHKYNKFVINRGSSAVPW